MIVSDASKSATFVVAPNRRGRPNDFKGRNGMGRCPFCPGNEADTEPTLWSDATPWRIRAFANKYPMLAPEDARQEVIVETPAHEAPWEAREPEDLERVMRALAAAERRMAAHPRAQTTVLWKNFGAWAGASLRHPHLQAMSLPYVAPTWREVGIRARAHVAESEAERDVASDALVAVVVPPMPRTTYEIAIVPRQRARALDRWSDATFGAVAHALATSFRALAALRGPAFDHNVLIHPECIAIVPRGRVQSGIELAAGVIELDLPPAEAARALRVEKSADRA